MRILVTAIGSMSAECVIRNLKTMGNFVVGCDIYPRTWHYETALCDKFYQAPYATDKERYIRFLLDICAQNDLRYIIPLTDLEIDVINLYRGVFENSNITLCMQSSQVLAIVRNKYELYKYFESDSLVPSIRTCLLTQLNETMPFPCLAKPYDGRSSEGLIRNATKEQLLAIANKGKYIVQEQLEGDVFTVDFCRSELTGVKCAIPRQELLRTKNGAGLTIQTIADKSLMDLSLHIGDKLNINGCVNMEFIGKNGIYYLIDINPRFSAGIAFSVLAGYDMVNNHLNCFVGKDVDKQVDILENIMIKKYQEVIMNLL